MTRLLGNIVAVIGGAGCAIWAVLWLGNALLWLYDVTSGAS